MSNAGFVQATGPGGRRRDSLPSSRSPPKSFQEPVSPPRDPQRLLPFQSHVGGHRPSSISPPRVASISLSKRPRSPVEYSDEIFASSLAADDWRGLDSAKKTKSPINSFESRSPVQAFNQPIEEPQRPIMFPSTWNVNRPSSLANFDNMAGHQKTSPIASQFNAPDAGLMSQKKFLNVNAPKRDRSPPLLSSEVPPEYNLYPVHDDSEREALAKAKRLSRFSKELQPLRNFTAENLLGKRRDQAPVGTQKINVQSQNDDMDIGGSTQGDQEDVKTSKVVIGLCDDMCPESEREERERKGDLDKYERLDGDRNQTTKHLAVKKYNRMAEREANLIRPMPVLKMTIEYLIGLLDQPYSENFLGIYNFLWDRMRAIRMDLRMQHLFNQDSITMLEKMIRLHIIAMHELCEYTKGEGFSEGFDAHLNIEQMNKTSVELFQLYDDYRKKGLCVPTEKEFRGYYALLKLDKHPGYKVEPAELSLDLAKMSSEVRGTSEVLFARNVARACRTSNFIAFFRLAKKASYLQACLMHAHFAKLRGQALASLHGGLQSNQGIPIPQIVSWIAMEGEDIESLLEYHGFSVKLFDVPYMVKEGPFLNSDEEFPNKCSHLVHSKKSRRIVDDVSPSETQLVPTSRRSILPVKVDNSNERAAEVIEHKSFVDVADEEMHLSDEVVFGKESALWKMPDVSSPSTVRDGKVDARIAKALPFEEPLYQSPSPARVRGVADIYRDNGFSLSEKLTSQTKGDYVPSFMGRTLPVESPVQSLCSPVNEMFSENCSPQLQVGSYGKSCSNILVENTLALTDVLKDAETVKVVPHEKDEVAAAKLKLMIRIWNRRSKKQKEIRKQRQLAAVMALNSLTLGPPILQNKAQLEYAGGLDIDQVMKERLHRHGKSWSRLNVAEVVGQMLAVSNPNVKCLCWKLVMCSQLNDTFAGKWLHSKLLGTTEEDEKELVVSSSSLSIWKKWSFSREGESQYCCLSIIKNVDFESSNLVEVSDIAGASSVLFVVSENLQWEIQKIRLHHLLQSLPPGSSLPLLVLVSGTPEEKDCSPLSIAARLALSDVDNNRVKSFSVIFLCNDQSHDLNEFLSDDRLREGLKWLANQSSSFPVLQEVQLRNLVLSYLRFSMEKLDRLEVLDPQKCISTFNEALDCSAEEIKAAAKVNHVGWPCPEIGLLMDHGDERRFIDLHLPSIGWSSASKIVTTVGKIMSCKLPSFSDDLSWLNQGSDMGKDVQKQKVELEKSLIWYLTGVSNTMSLDVAEREVHIMLQKGCFLKLNGNKYYIVPRWQMMYQRIYNWRLENLVGGELSSAYVLEDDCKNCSEPRQLRYSLAPAEHVGRVPNADMLVPYYLDYDVLSDNHSTEIPLDEMIGVGCQLPSSWSRLVPDTSLGTGGGGEAMGTAENNLHPDEPSSKDDRLDESAGSDFCDASAYQNNELAAKAKDTDRLSMLLERCKSLQSMIHEKLSIYF